MNFAEVNINSHELKGVKWWSMLSEDHIGGESKIGKRWLIMRLSTSYIGC
jgi:hypothetical protein